MCSSSSDESADHVVNGKSFWKYRKNKLPSAFFLKYLQYLMTSEIQRHRRFDLVLLPIYYLTLLLRVGLDRIVVTDYF